MNEVISILVSALDQLTEEAIYTLGNENKVDIFLSSLSIEEDLKILLAEA